MSLTHGNNTQCVHKRNFSHFNVVYVLVTQMLICFGSLKKHIILNSHWKNTSTGSFGNIILVTLFVFFRNTCT